MLASTRQFLSWCWLGLLCLLALPAEAAPPFVAPALTPFASARCGFVTDCTRFEAIGLHLGTSGVLLMPQAQAESRSLDLQDGLRLSLTALEILEVGSAASGRLLHSTNVSAATQSQPLQLMVRVRLLPLPVFPLSQPRLSLTYQHDLVLPHFGLGVATSSGLVRLVASDMLGPVELSGSAGVEG